LCLWPFARYKKNKFLPSQTLKNVIACLVLWSEESGRDANSMMTFPIKKRINTELFIDRTAVLYIMEGRIKDENVVREVNHWHRLIPRSSIQCGKSAKDAGLRN